MQNIVFFFFFAFSYTLNQIATQLDLFEKLLRFITLRRVIYKAFILVTTEMETPLLSARVFVSFLSSVKTKIRLQINSDDDREWGVSTIQSNSSINIVSGIILILQLNAFHGINKAHRKFQLNNKVVPQITSSIRRNLCETHNKPNK